MTFELRRGLLMEIWILDKSKMDGEIIENCACFLVQFFNVLGMIIVYNCTAQLLARIVTYGIVE